MKLSPNSQVDWQAEWIGTPKGCLNNWQAKILPAPYFRRVFSWDKPGTKAKILICGLGLYELYLNGQKVSDHVLDPVVTQYDRRALYVVHDVTDLLIAGNNVVGVILGNGLYNCFTPGAWHFDKASWRDYPKLLLQLETEKEVLLTSDRTWKTTTGPIVFDGWRNGETYDARLELTGWAGKDYDDSSWTNAAQVAPPGGVLQEQTMPPCKVMQTIPFKEKWISAKGTIYDIGQNMTGWTRITVTGKAGAEIQLVYSERITSDRQLDRRDLTGLNDPEHFQTDRYILKGQGEEIWEPRFTYHGFQYAEVSIKGKAEIKNLEGRVVHTAFEKCGELASSDANLNKLQECTEWAYISNFVGIPTDCPHREKNGWTGDAQLACETGLFNYKAASSYIQWLQSIADIQRPSGQLPGIVPSCGWGFNWGNGPAWDSAFILIPWYIYLYTGDSTAITTHYDAMKKYVDYLTFMAEDHIVSIGLGDWCHPDRDRIVDRGLTDTAYYYVHSLTLAKFAEITGRSDDLRKYTELAGKIKQAFNRQFYKGYGLYARGEQTAMGCALYQGLVEEAEKDAVVKRLVDTVKANGGKPDFGILGAKYVPRALAENGHVELAYQMIIQPEYPGWVNWLKMGATTLWENWDSSSSRNHIMFGDISAWFYQYLAGITPDPENPGFKHFIIKPHSVAGLDWIKAEHDSLYGKIKVAWRKTGRKTNLEVQVPQHTTATVI